MWLKKFSKFLPIIIIFSFAFVLFFPSLKDGKIPIPADTIVGLYHPWRDSLAKDYPQGVPYKNFQITDPVRQQFPWRQLSIENLKNGELPLWNPYNFSGTPLLGNLQGAGLYPGNVLFLLLDFVQAWTLLVILQIILGGLFMYLYLRQFNLRAIAVSIGVLSWIGCGFFVAWQQWNTVVHTAIWLPLILLSVDKIFTGKKIWSVVFVGSLVASFLAGYLQPFFYITLVAGSYILFRFLQTKSYRKLFLFIFLFVLFGILTFPQLFTTFQFIGLSARDVDQSNWMRPDWFLPFENLIQLAAPDFFGNPATLNYFGVWNYQEFVSYIGIAPLIFSLIALFFWKDKNSLFFKILLLAVLIFVLPTPIAKIPFIFNLPFIGTAQPSRLVFLVCFTLTVMSAFGANYFLNQVSKAKTKWLIILLVTFSLIVSALTIYSQNNPISFRNMYLPGALTFITATTLIVALLVPRLKTLLVFTLLVITFFELLRFGSKFLPFSDPSFLYPKSKVIEFLQKNTSADFTRVAAADERIFAPNLTLPYKLQLISGYDPLYLKRYGEFIASMERNKPDPSTPFGFNRIITPKNYNSKFFDFLGVRYVLSMDPISSPKYKLVFEEGQTKVYENTLVSPRAFFAENAYFENDKQKIFDRLFQSDFDPAKDIIISGPVKKTASGSAKIKSYSENDVVIETSGEGGYLVLTDVDYPIWHATIDGKEVEIYPANYAFRAVFVPEGRHEVRFFAKLF